MGKILRKIFMFTFSGLFGKTHSYSNLLVFCRRLFFADFGILRTTSDTVYFWSYKFEDYSAKSRILSDPPIFPLQPQTMRLKGGKNQYKFIKKNRIHTSLMLLNSWSAGVIFGSYKTSQKICIPIDQIFGNMCYLIKLSFNYFWMNAISSLDIFQPDIITRALVLVTEFTKRMKIIRRPREHCFPM